MDVSLMNLVFGGRERDAHEEPRFLLSKFEERFARLSLPHCSRFLLDLLRGYESEMDVVLDTTTRLLTDKRTFACV